VPSGVSSSTGNPQNRWNDSRSDSASSTPENTSAAEAGP
jgi:hypothetical protein